MLKFPIFLFVICFTVSLSILNTITWKFLTNNYNKNQLCICFNYFFFSLFLNSCSCLLPNLVIFLGCQIWHIKFSDPMDGSPPGSSIHGAFQARTLEWFAISFCRGSFPPKDRTCISCISSIGRQVLYQPGFITFI